MDIDKVVGVDSRILVGPQMHLFSLTGVPVNNRRRTRNDFVAVERRQHVEELLSVLSARLLSWLGFRVLLTLCTIFLEECHQVRIPVDIGSMLELVIIDDLFVLLGSQDVVIRSDIGMWRTNIILYANTCYHWTRNHCCKILGIEITQEGIHLVVSHITLISLCHIARPANNLEVVGEITHEGDSRSDSLEGITAQCCSSIGEGTSLALTLGKEVIHITGRTRSKEIKRTHAVHISTTIVVAILIAKVEGKPVAVGIGKVFIYTIYTFARLTVVHALTTSREDKLCIACTLVGIARGIDTPWCSTVATRTVF